MLPAFLLARAALPAFVAWERRSDHPMLPLTLFRNPRFSTATGVVTIAFFVMFGFFFLITQYFQFARGYSPLEPLSPCYRPRSRCPPSRREAPRWRSASAPPG